MTVSRPLAAGSREGLTSDVSQTERVLGEALKDFAADLRLIDAAGLAALIHIGHMPNLQQLVRSSAELYFKPGTLELAETGELEMSWFSPPLITLPMIFRHAGIFVYFRLRLAALTASVEIDSCCAEGPAGEAPFHLALDDALKSARLGAFAS
jgi:hypothetical protein